MCGMDAIAEHEAKYSKERSMLEIIFPGNTNSLGTAFGGHMLSLMDKADVRGGTLQPDRRCDRLN